MNSYRVLIKILNDIKLNMQEIPADLLRVIISDLIIKNPAYIKAIRMDLRSKYDIPETIKLFQLDDNILILPRGYGRKMLQRFKEAAAVYQVEDNRLTLPPVRFNSSIQLRNYQAPAVDALVKHRQGGVVAGCGAGKTMIMLEAMARIGQPSLWITHTQELADQVTQRAMDALCMTKEEIGRIGGGKFSIGNRLTVALIQTLAKSDLITLVGKFGAVLVDEAHHLAAKSFYYPIGQFPALYRLWASATPERADGLTEMVFAAGGPILHVVNSCQVPTITPRLEVVETDYSGTGEYVELVSDLIQNGKRNSLVTRTIAAEAQGNYCLVLSDRVEHLETLQQLLTNKLPDLVIETLTGSMRKKVRTELMERVNNRQVNILLATQFPYSDRLATNNLL